MKTNDIKTYLRLAVVALLTSTCIVGCQEEEVLNVGNGMREPMNLQAEIHQQNVTRVNDNGFADGDHIGVFVTNYNNGVATELALTGNHADNVRFTYDYESGRWTGATQLYWKDKVTPIDAYGYYPFDEELSSVTAYPFTVQRNQRDQIKGEAMYGYEASDFLWAKAEGIVPTAAAVNLRHKHIMAGIQVNLVEGAGFEEGEWELLSKQVMVENTRLGSTISLQTGKVSVEAASAINSIIPQGSGDSYRAIVVPQTIDGDKTLFSITIGGKTHQFTRSSAMTYHPAKLHKFTFDVNYSLPTGDYQLNLLDEAVVAWENDTESHNGAAREYITVHVNEGEYIGDVIERMGIDPKEIVNLKLTGTLSALGLRGSEWDEEFATAAQFQTDKQFAYIRKYIPYLESINMRDLRTKGQMGYPEGWGAEGVEGQYGFPLRGDDYIPIAAFERMEYLSYVVWPEVLKAIGSYAFAGTNLRGSLILPEGVKHIGNDCFCAYGHQLSALSGELYIPSTVEYIGSHAFGGYDGKGLNLTGELVLPSKMKYLGPGAFAYAKYLTGKIQIPDGLTEVNEAWLETGVTGYAIVPQGVKKINGIGCVISGIHIPEGVEEIGVLTGGDWPRFRDKYSASLSQYMVHDIQLPSTIKRISENAFNSVHSANINIPAGFDVISEGAFRYAGLQDTITIPSTVIQIKDEAFSDCYKLTAVVLPAGLQEIQGRAFANCASLDYIRCLGTEPPILDPSAFDGVEKNNFTVVVPDGAVETYRNAPGWCEFKRISSYRNFVCRPMFAHLLNKSNTRTVILNADGNWKITHCPDWAHSSVTSGYKKTELTVTIDQLARGAGNRNDSIIFTLTDKVDEEGNPITCYYSIVQYDSEYDEDSQLQLQQATKGKGIDIVFIGDGYDAEDIASGQCLTDFQEGMEYFFAVEPYKTYKEYFNVYAQFPLSYESGVCSHVNIWRDTKFDTTYGAGDEGRLKVNFDEMMAYVLNDVEDGAITGDNVNESLIITILNSDVYEGLTQMWSSGAAIAAVPHSRNDYPNDYRGLIQHEAGGHGFAKLGDEYIYHRDYIQKCPCLCCGHVDALQFDHVLGWSRNLSLTGKYKEIEWTHLIFDDRYQDIVDIYEGGYFHSKGVYRSEVNSCMNNNVPYFSTWSRQIAVERIKAIAGEQFDFEEFVAHDSREWGDKFLTRSGGDGSAATALHNPTPIVKKGSPAELIRVKGDRRR